MCSADTDCDSDQKCSPLGQCITRCHGNSVCGSKQTCHFGACSILCSSSTDCLINEQCFHGACVAMCDSGSYSNPPTLSHLSPISLPSLFHLPSPIYLSSLPHPSLYHLTTTWQGYRYSLTETTAATTSVTMFR